MVQKLAIPDFNAYRVFFLGFFLVIASCNWLPSTSEDKGPILAEVYNKKLFLHDVSRYIPEGTAPEDSLQIALAFIDKWIKETLLLHEAEKHVPKDLEIENLVTQYRASLILSNFEKEWVEAHLDTLVTEEEIEQYYEGNKEQYQLETTIMRCRLLKLNSKITPRDNEFVRNHWRSNNRMDMRYLERVCREFGEICLFDKNEWHKLDKIKSLLPSGSVNENTIRNNREVILKDDEYQYYLQIFEDVADKELAPLSFIRDQAVKFILHKRKLKLLDELKESIYEQEAELNNVKIYSN